MKSKLLTAAALAVVASAASAQSSVTVYGIADAGFQYLINQAPATGTSDSNKFALNGTNESTSRFGLKGTEDLGGGLNALFQLEGGLNFGTGVAGTSGFTGSTSTTKLFDRAAIVGLGSNAMGTITLGRQQTVLSDALAVTDSIAYRFAATNPNLLYGALVSADYSGFGSNSGQSLTLTSSTSSGAFREDNSAKYYKSFGPVTLGLNYAAAGATSRGTATGASLAYADGPLVVNAAYLTLNGNGATSTAGVSGSTAASIADSSRLQAWTLGTGYTFGPAKVNLTYAQNKSDTTGLGGTLYTNVKTTTWGLGGTYAATPAVDLIVAYYNIKRQADSYAAGDLGYSRVYLIADYKLSKRTNLYGAIDYAKYNSAMANSGGTNYAFGNYSLTGSSNNVTYNIGVRHMF
ncbi:MAG: porin [Candidatus Protistobacter heckmanni]|nr:porin [Candidatus Protistobacter heckmanni]